MSDLFNQLDEIEAFNKFWEAYPAGPRKVARRQCLEKWCKRRLSPALPQMLAHIAEMRDSEQWKAGFVPLAMTYINQDRWEGLAQPAKRISPSGAMPLFIPEPRRTPEQIEHGKRMAADLAAKFSRKIAP